MYKKVQNFRLDFISFAIAGPDSSTAITQCLTDTFTVSGAFNNVPVICGTNTNQHSITRKSVPLNTNLIIDECSVRRDSDWNKYRIAEHAFDWNCDWPLLEHFNCSHSVWYLLHRTRWLPSMVHHNYWNTVIFQFPFLHWSSSSKTGVPGLRNLHPRQRCSYLKVTT